MKQHQWSALTFEHEFYLVQNQPSYELPSDFDRFINNTMWDRVEARPIDRVSPQVWADFKGGMIKTVIYKRFRVKANDNTKELWIDPTPSTTQCSYENRDGAQVRLGVAFDYISNAYALSSAGADLSAFAADTDTLKLDDDLFELDLTWRWLNTLGRDYGEEKDEFNRAFGLAKAQDGGLQNLRADTDKSNFNYPNIPESGVGL